MPTKGSILVTKTIQSYAYRGRHHHRKATLFARALSALSRVSDALAPAWFAVRDSVTSWAPLLAALALVATLVSHAPATPDAVPQPTEPNPTVVTLPTPYPRETTR